MNMLKHIFSLILLFFIVFVLLMKSQSVFAQECDSSCKDVGECKRKIEKCQEAWNSMEAAKKPHVDALKKMEADIAAFQARLQVLQASLAKKARAIEEGEKELAGLLESASAKVRQFYIRAYAQTPFQVFFSSEDMGKMMRLLTYQQMITDQQKKDIAHTAVAVSNLEEKKRELEREQASLSYIKEETDKRAASVRRLVAEANAYQSQVFGFIASLTAQQQAILNARAGVFTTSVGDVPLSDDPNSRPTYNPGFSPAFAGFSFGAYTHRKGMSQYGAKGRAQNGQSANDILRAYYGKTPEAKDTGGSISVQGVGSVNFEEYYLYGIAEMPADFPKEALKAQAIAARSYAWRYKQQGKSICTTQSCQVFLRSKADNPPQAWKDAVNETRGQIIEGVITYYSSTTGGYITTSGWDTMCGNQGCWTADAYEKIANSPWFYKGWYTESYLNSSSKCGRAHPWLNSEEFADILNAWQVRKNGGDTGRILPVTINSCPVNGARGNPYSMSELRDMGGFSSVSSVSVTYNSNGYTDTVILATNKGEIRISGAEFREVFNLRAPGYISIRSPLFNIEKK
jgi:peptidoglycan hydrolase CwlO-like protein